MDLVVTLGDRGFLVTAEEIEDGLLEVALLARLAELMRTAEA